jgi:hypothetical protein
MHDDSQISVTKNHKFLLQLDGHSYNEAEDGSCWMRPIDRSPRQGDAPEVVEPKDLAWLNAGRAGGEFASHSDTRSFQLEVRGGAGSYFLDSGIRTASCHFRKTVGRFLGLLAT